MAFASKTHYVRFVGGAQSVISIPLDGDGDPALPSAATYEIADLRYDEDSTSRAIVAAGTAGTIDSASTTLTAAAGAGSSNRSLLALTDATNFTEGHKYLLTDATTGRRYLVEVDHKKTNNLYLTSPINQAVATASAITGVEVTATMTSAEAADEDRLNAGGGPYAVKWTWTGVDPTTQREMLWVRRTPWLTQIVSLDDCDRLDPGARTILRNEAAAKAFLEQAHADWHAELRAAALDPSKLEGAENSQEYIKHRWAFHMRSYMPGEVDDYNDRLAQKYEKRALILLHTFTIQGNNPVGTVAQGQNDVSAEGTSPNTANFWGKS